jgi:hypothetical protein
MKYLFIRVPRTASGSIKSILGSAGHIFAKDLKAKTSDWNERFKFAFVRNPYERFLSGYYYLNLGTDPNGFLSEGAEVLNIPKYYPIFVPQHKFICIDGKIALDFVGRFERLQEDWKFLQEKLEVEAKLPVTNESFTKKDSLNKRSKQVLFKYYKQDFKAFDFKQF